MFNAAKKYPFGLLTIFLIWMNTGFSQVDFKPNQKIEIGSVTKLKVTDFNNDGLDDILVMTDQQLFEDENSYKFFLYISNGTNTLSSPYIFPYSENWIIGFEVDDVNNDNLKDIIISFRDSIGIFYQNNSGTFGNQQNYPCGRLCYEIHTGDLNNDGLADIVIKEANGWVRIMYQNQNGFDVMDYLHPEEVSGIMDVADLNGDNLDDLVFFKSNPQSIHVSYQNTEQTYDQFVSYNSPVNPSNNFGKFTIGDVNNDGRNDVITMYNNSPTQPSSMYIWNQDASNGLLQQPEKINTYYSPLVIKVSDINCDGKNEIVMCNDTFSEKLSVFEQDESGNFGDYQLFDISLIAGMNQNGISIGDINNDGRKDVVIANDRDGFLILYNSSPPDEYDSLYTTIVEDTINTSVNHDSTFYYSYLSIDTIPGYIFVAYDSLLISGTFRIDEIRIDSLIIGTGFICSNTVIDTLEIHAVFTERITAISSDTTVIVSQRDYFSFISDFSIYPNPTTGVVNIEIPYPYDFLTRIVVYNDMGVKVYEVSYNEIYNLRQIDLSPYSDGVYTIAINFNQFKVVKRVVKMSE